MSKKDQKPTAKAEELVSDALESAPGENGLPEGSEEKAGDQGEEKGAETPETPPSSDESKDPKVSEEKPKSDDRRLKVSVLASGKLFAAGMKAAEIDSDVVESIPSKYFEGEK